jgi:ABC-type multidrug transport system fused ATPase/permease subunit
MLRSCLVGRTGSGKSTLTVALLRAISTTGEVHYDGLDISRTNLNALRSNISIIPQAPELVVGTLRQNIDPWGQHNDAMLNDALRSAGLSSLPVANSNGETRLTLDFNITAGGGNLSLGQRQIISLARAMVRQSKILILDEATSAIGA